MYSESTSIAQSSLQEMEDFGIESRFYSSIETTCDELEKGRRNGSQARRSVAHKRRTIARDKQPQGTFPLIWRRSTEFAESVAARDAEGHHGAGT